MGLSWRCSEIWIGSRKVTLQKRALGAADTCSAGSSQSYAWTKPDLLFLSSAEANLAVQEQVLNVTYHGANPLPVGIGGSNSLALL